MKKFGGDKKYLYWGMTAFVVIAGCILLYLLIVNWQGFLAGLGKLLTILSPFIWGAVIAYLLRPAVQYFGDKLTGPLGNRLFKKSESRAFGFGRAAAIFLSETVMILVVGTLMYLVMPQLYSSVVSIVSNSNDYYDKVVTWGAKMLNDYPQVESVFVSVVGGASTSLVNWASDILLPQMTSVVTNITSGVMYMIKGIYYVVIGIIVSVYILFNKENVSTGAKKVVYSIFSLQAAEKLLDGVRFTDKIFKDFVTGKIIDSAIIGVICYFCCLLMRMPYAMLISVIVGVTNVIPFFGPFIGAIPSAFIILMMDPMKCLIFLLYILVLQQFDGNVLGPKILGGSIGINGFWIMFSIIFGAGLFGFAGMLLGVPVFVVIYTYIQNRVNKKLERSGLPTETALYETLHHFKSDTGERVELPPPPTAEQRRAQKSRERQEYRERVSERAARLLHISSRKQDADGEKKENSAGDTGGDKKD